MKYPSQYPRATPSRLVETFWTFWPAFQRWADAQAGDVPGRTPQRTRILAILQERGPQIMSTLKAELGVTATNVTALIDGLERDGLVERRPHPSDRRATLIHARTKKDCAGYRERVAEVFETTLTEEERRELLCLLDKILTALPASEVPDNRR